MLNIRNLVKWYGNKQILKNFSLQIPTKQVATLVGPSGSGKTTTLRCITELEPYQGSIDISTNNAHKATMVFQSFNLFNNMNVLQNLTYAPIKVLGLPPEAAITLAQKNLGKVGLADYANAYPKNLSGGQRQRVAIARAMCMNPAIMLFDEPTSALDPENKREVLDVIKDLAHTGMTMLTSTHELRFAEAVSDRIIFMDHGNILEDNDAKNFFTHPQHTRVRHFLERMDY